MTEPGRVRRTSKTVATKPGCAPLKAAYAEAEALKPKSWRDVEKLFLTAMQAFDRNVASGAADMGDLQNGKGDFFNDLLALLLENCASVRLYSRGQVPGLIIPKHNLDVTFPRSGPIEFVLEAKALGTPKHPGSPKQKPVGRAGSADLDKRVKEIGFKAIDLKAEFARIEAQMGTSPSSMGGDLTTWLRSVKPRFYVFLVARVINDADEQRLIRLAEQAALVCDAVGVFAFRPGAGSDSAPYRSVSVPSPLDIGRVLFRACKDLAGVKAARPLDT